MFDADAVAREKWEVKPPHIDPDGYFFSADTIEELAAGIVNEYQWRPMPKDALRKSVERYNSFVDSGVDADFKKPRPLYKITTPPFYAAWHTPAIHDSYTGIRMSPSAEVIDLRGKAIPAPICVRGLLRRIWPARHLQGGHVRPHRRLPRRGAGRVGSEPTGRGPDGVRTGLLAP